MKKIKLIAIVAALIAGLCLYQFLKEISKPVETPRTEIVVASAFIPENTTITEDMITLKKVATEALLPNHMRDIENVVGMVASGDIYAGEQIIKERLVQVGHAEEPSDTLAYVVEPGMRAVTFSVNAVTGLSNMLKPGNRVDIVMSYVYENKILQPDGTEDAVQVPSARLLLQDIEVLAVDAVLGKGGASEYSTVTLMMTPEEAVEFCLADNTGNIRLILRSSLDEEELGEIRFKGEDVAIRD